MGNESVIVTKLYYSLRAVLLQTGPLCKNSLTNPDMHMRVFINDPNPRLDVYMSRPGYSDVGYHVGTESCTVSIPLAERSKITGAVDGIFADMDHWLCDLDAADVTDMQNPEEASENYSPPDKDFWWEEFQREFEHHVRNVPMPEYSFNTVDSEGNVGRFWTIIGDDDAFTWNLDELTPAGSIWATFTTEQRNDLDGYSA